MNTIVRRAAMTTVMLAGLSSAAVRIEAQNVSVDVRDFGAAGDGITDDTLAIRQAQRALPASGGVVFFPEGVYAIGGSGILLQKSSITFRGAGATRSFLKRLPPGGPTAQSSAGSAGVEHLVFEELAFDGDLVASGAPNYSTLALYGNAVTDVRISRCHFWRSSAAAVGLSGMANVVVEDSVFQSPGDATATAITITKGASHITIRGNRFLYLKNGIVIDTGTSDAPPPATADFIDVSDNYFDLGWWLIKTKFTGEGHDVTYTADGLSDPNAQFDFGPSARGVAPPSTYNIRVMPRRAAGAARISIRTVDDDQATFLSSGVRRGDVVRVADVFAVVASVSSETSLEVEDWLSNADRTSTAAPSARAAYQVYGVYFGMATTYTTTSLGTTRWWDFDGRTVTPPAGTRYEVLVARPNYALHAEAGTRQIIVTHNTFRRGWSDQISLYGSTAVVTDNTIEDGQDMGITVHGQDNRVEANTITHQGAGGIYITATDTRVAHNIVRDSQWVNDTNLTYLGDIILYDAQRVEVFDNLCERLLTTLGYHGIVVYGARAGATDNELTYNVSRNHLAADIKLVAAAGSSVTGTRLLHNEGTLVSDGATSTVIEAGAK